MVKVRPGDKVRFLNDEGGGIITRVVGSTVYVEDEDGFEIPTLSSDVVVVEQQAVQKQQAEERRIEAKKEEVEEILVDYDYKYEDDQSDDHVPRFMLAFLKSDRGNSGYLDLYAVNDSNSFVFFTLCEQVGNTDDVCMLHYGTIEPNTKLQLDKYNPQRIDNQVWQCQLLLFKKSKTFGAYPPVSTSIKIKATKFFRENSFVDNDFFDDKAVVHHIIKDELTSKIEQLTVDEMMRASLMKEQKEKRPESKRSAMGLIEVDLHIDEIIDSTAGLSNGEMLELQLARFNRVMQENLDRKGQRIVFIHGVGNGRLKTDIRKQLERKYGKCEYQDASFKEYGYGATMVKIC
jgi:hypothetical protein